MNMHPTMTKQCLLIVVSCLALLFPVSSDASISLQSRNIYASNNGLSSNRVLDITQDSQGFIWMGTSTGISRYDGNLFYNIERPIVRNNPLTYADNRISDVRVDANNLLWMKSRSKEISCYDLTQDRFLDIPFDDEHPNEYDKLLFVNNGSVIGRTSNNGVVRFTLSSNRQLIATYYSKENKTLPDNSIRFTINDSKNNIWVGTKHGLAILTDPASPLAASRPSFIPDSAIYCEAGIKYQDRIWVMGRYGYAFSYDPANLARQPEIYRFDDVKPSVTRINSSAVVGDKWLIVGENNSYEFDFTNKKLSFSKYFDKKGGHLIFDNNKKPYFFNYTSTLYQVPDDLDKEPKLLVKDLYRTDNTISKENYNVLCDMDNNLWISTTASGMFCYEAGSETPAHYAPGTENNHDLITSSAISCMFMDNQGGIWIGVNRTGICYILPNQKGASRHFIGKEGDLTSKNAICYVGQNGENIQVANRLGELITYDQDFNVLQTRKFNGNVYDVLNDSYGHEWICTRGNEGLVVDGVSYKKGNGPDDLKSNNVFSALEDTKGRVWLCTMGGGLALADTKSNPIKFRTFFDNSAKGVTMKQMVQGRKDGKIWVSTGEGLIIFDPDELIADTSKYMHCSLRKGNFFVNETNCLWAGTSGSVWVGSLGRGVARCTFIGDSLACEVFTTEQGLVNNEVSGIYSDRKSGYLWISAIGGITRFNVKTHICDNYTFSREPLGNVYDTRTVAVFPDGRFVEGTYYGMTVIDPSRYIPDEKCRKPIISGFTVNGQRLKLHDPQNNLLQRSAGYAKEIALTSQQNNLHFDFFVPGFNYKRRFSYWLEGHDQDWSEGSYLPYADFNYLDPGEYKLHVRATNDMGVWTKDGHTVIRIYIAPSIWMSKKAFLAYGIIALLVAGAVVAFFLLRKRKR